MKPMDLEDKESEIKKLSQMLNKIQNLYYKKKDQLQELQSEISELREVLNFLNSFISNRSFQSADEIYSKSIEKAPVEDNYFIEELPKDRVKGTNIKRKIFSKAKGKESKLLCILNFFDFNTVEIKFIDPPERAIKETLEGFVRIFLKGALVKIKDTSPKLSVNYDYFKDSDLIEKIKISNLNSINEYDLITSKMRELLAQEISSSV